MKVLWRYVIAWMGCLGIMNVYFCRINLSVAIVAMVGITPPTTTTTTHCPGPDLVVDNVTTITTNNTAEFQWSKKEQGLVTGAYYWGYAVCQIPAAWLASKWGFRRVFGYSMLISSLLTLTFPLAASVAVSLAIVSRVLLGVFHAVAFPAMAGAWGVWSPPMETTKLNGIHWSGASIGTLIIFTLAGYVADYLGWQSIFYITGSLSLVWVIVWFQLVWDSPAQHPYIHQDEREYIEGEIGIGKDVDRSRLITPWRQILTSIPVWGVVLGHTASNWGNYTLNQQLPTYLSNVLRYSLSFQGILSSLCYLLQWCVCLVASWATDQIRSRGLMRTLHVRKLNTFLGLWVTGVCVVLATYAGCQAELAVFLFALSAGLNTLTVPGCKSGVLDIAPAYSGIVFGVSNTAANIPGFVAPALVGFLLTDYSDTTQWTTVFWVSCGVHIVGSLVYLLGGSDQLQEWAIPKQQEQDNMEGKDKN